MTPIADVYIIMRRVADAQPDCGVCGGRVRFVVQIHPLLGRRIEFTCHGETEHVDWPRDALPPVHPWADIEPPRELQGIL